MKKPDVEYSTPDNTEKQMKAWMWHELANLFTTLQSLAETGHQAIKDQVVKDKIGGRR